MVPTKPYLIRAIYEWCSDQGLTPYLAVQVNDRTRVPRQFVSEGQIVLNIGANATHQMRMGNDEIIFQARFNGSPFPVSVPVDAVAAIYARENGQGLVFETQPNLEEGDLAKVGHDETAIDEETAAAGEAPPPAPRRGAHLTRIK